MPTSRRRRTKCGSTISSSRPVSNRPARSAGRRPAQGGDLGGAGWPRRAERFVGGRERDGELRALARLRLHVDVAAGVLHDALTDREAEARSLLLRGEERNEE